MGEVQVVKWCVSPEAGSIFEATGEDLSVLCWTRKGKETQNYLMIKHTKIYQFVCFFFIFIALS